MKPLLADALCMAPKVFMGLTSKAFTLECGIAIAGLAGWHLTVACYATPLASWIL